MRNWFMNREGKRYLMWVLAGVIAGILLMYGASVIRQTTWKQWSEEWEACLKKTLNRGEFFLYLMGSRLHFYGILLLFSLTKLGRWYRSLLCGYQGLSYGVFLYVLLSQYGLFGGLLFLVRFFPQGIVLAGAFFFALTQLQKIQMNAIKRTNRAGNVIGALMVLVAIIVGSLLEAYCNPPLMRMLIR